jgi:hypothetical protein
LFHFRLLLPLLYYFLEEAGFYFGGVRIAESTYPYLSFAPKGFVSDEFTLTNILGGSELSTS